MKAKILILGTTEHGGVSVYVSSLIKRIEEFKFYAPIAPNMDKTNITNLFPNAVLVEINQNYSIKTIREILKTLNQIIKKNDINIIHAHTLRAGSLATIYRLIFRPNTKIIYTGHGLRYTQKNNWLTKKVFKFLECFTNTLSNKVVYIRESEYNLALKDKIVSPFKSVFIRTQIHREENKTKSIDIRSAFQIETQYIVANAASIYDLKNPDLFIKIARNVLIKNNNVTFVWFGDGLTIKEINKRLELENLSNKIKFVGAIKPDLMLNIFQQIDGLLLTSKIETFPLVILEAYLTKTLVFCTNFIGSSEIVKDKKTGFIYDMNNPENASNLILNNLLDPTISNKIVEQASDYFNDTYNNINKFVSQHIELYKSV